MGLERTALPTSWGRIGPECLNLTVPYSRLLWLRFFKRQDMRTLFEGLEQALPIPGWRFEGGALRPDAFRSSWKTVVGRVVRSLRIPSSFASLITGSFDQEPVARIARRPRAKWRGPSATFARTSSTVVTFSWFGVRTTFCGEESVSFRG